MKPLWLILSGEDHKSALVTCQDGSTSCACRSLHMEAAGSEWVMQACRSLKPSLVQFHLVVYLGKAQEVVLKIPHAAAVG